MRMSCFLSMFSDSLVLFFRPKMFNWRMLRLVFPVADFSQLALEETAVRRPITSYRLSLYEFLLHFSGIVFSVFF